MDIGVPDILAAVIAAAATLGLFAAYDVLIGGGSINWLLDSALAVGAGAATLYFRTADLEDA